MEMNSTTLWIMLLILFFIIPGAVTKFMEYKDMLEIPGNTYLGVIVVELAIILLLIGYTMIFHKLYFS